MREPYLPFGFTQEEEKDPIVSEIKNRMEWLNSAIDRSGIPGHLFTAALDLYQTTVGQKIWVPDRILTQDLIHIAKSLLPLVAEEPERLEFPNVVDLVDCRFISTPEWERIRRFSIGGSDSGIIMGKSHYRSERELWLDKMGRYRTLKDRSRDYLFAYGHEVEDFVLEKLAALLGAKRVPEHRMFRNKEIPFLTVNMDGILQFPDLSLTVGEAKTAIRWKMEDWKTSIPEDYSCQLNHYMGNMADARLTTANIACVFGALPKDWASYKVQMDPIVCSNQIEAEIRWWHDYIIGNKMPPLSGDTDMDKRAIYLDTQLTIDRGKQVDLPAADLTLVQAILQSREDRKKLSKEANAIKAEEKKALATIAARCPEGTSVCTRAGRLTYRIRRKERILETVDTSVLSALDMTTLQNIATRQAPDSFAYRIPKVK